MDSQAFNWDVQPSPILSEAVVKVEQMVARLQELQCTIAGLHKSSRTVKDTCTYEAEPTRILDLSGCTCSATTVAPTNGPGEFRRQGPSETGQKIFIRELQPRGAWKQWSSPANQVHEVMSEILLASQFAKQVATLVGNTLQESPEVQTPAQTAQNPAMPICKYGKRKDIAFPTNAQVHKTMAAKETAPKAVHKFKVVMPADGPAKIEPAVNIFPLKDLPKSSSPSPLYKRHTSTGLVSRLSSPKAMAPRSQENHFVAAHSPQRSGKPQMHESAKPVGSKELWADTGISMEVTEIKGQPKPWKLTPTKGILFSNPTFTSSPSTSLKAVKPARKKRKSWLTYHFSKAQGNRTAIGKTLSSKPISSNSVNPTSYPVSQVLSKKEIAAKSTLLAVSNPDINPKLGSTKSVILPPACYVEVVSPDGLLDVINLGSPPNISVVTQARPAQSSKGLTALDSNIQVVNNTEKEQVKQLVKKKIHGRISRSHSMSSSMEKLALKKEKNVAFVKGTDPECNKENEQVVPSCGPAAMFLRSFSSGHDLNRPLSASTRKSGASLFQRAKGWISSQNNKQERECHEFDR